MMKLVGGGRRPSKMIIDCAVETKWWSDPAHLEELATSTINGAVRALDHALDADCEVSLLFTDDAQVQQLNEQWRQIDKPTNVLSFAAREAGGPATPALGDIVLARETIEREAAQQNKTPDDHLIHLIVHGFLHLLGFDHETDEEADEMEAVEIKILSQLNIADPYAEA